MSSLDETMQGLRRRLDVKNAVRDATLGRARELTRLSANSIRASHRGDFEQARALLVQARELASEMRAAVADHPDLYYTGYTQDALKELAEAHITYAIIRDDPVPSADELQMEPPAYLNGLGEAMGEMRRHVLDLIREDKLDRAEAVLSIMDEAYWHLVSIDFPSAITSDLRRTTDMVRGVLERTRADLTTSQEGARLRDALKRFEERLGAS